MQIQLPPKRFQSPSSEQFAPIAHKKWFRDLSSRRDKIPLLGKAYAMMKHLGKSQAAAAREVGVDVRELRDFHAYWSKKNRIPLGFKAGYQSVLDSAYNLYCHKMANVHFYRCIDDAAKLNNLNKITGRRVKEAWDTDFNFYPTGYVRP